MLLFGALLSIAKTPAAATASTVLFFLGFLYGGWLLYANWLQLIFFCIACILACNLTFKISQKYIQANKSGTTYYYSYPFLDNSDTLKGWLKIFAFTFLCVLTFKLWGQPPGLMTGLLRMLLIGATFGLPFTPAFRGAIGSVALGIIGGIVAILVSSIAVGILSFLYKIIMK